MKKVLITGFDPFGDDSVNPALEAVKKLAGIVTEKYEVQVREIPTVFNKSLKYLEKAILQIQPDIVICVGQAGRHSH